MTLPLRQIQAIRQILVLVVFGFCYSNCFASMPFPQPEVTSDHKAAISGVAALMWRPQSQEETESQSALSGTVGSAGKCDDPGKLTQETLNLVSVVKDARATARGRMKSAASFIEAIRISEHTFDSFQRLASELRRVLNSVKRHQDTQEILLVRTTFQGWYDTVQNVVQRLRVVDSEPAQFWLHNVYLNLTQQREAFENMRLFLCNFSSEAGATRVASRLRVVSDEFKRELTTLDDIWKTNVELLNNVSRAALTLDTELHGIDKTVRQLQKFTTKLEVVKKVNRRFRKLNYFLDDAQTLVSRELYKLLSKHLDSNWIMAIEKSSYRGFLSNLTAAERRQLDEVMLFLRNSVRNLKRATDNLPTMIYDAIRNHLRANDQNQTGDPPTVDLTDELIHSLDVFIDKVRPVSNGWSLNKRLISQLQTAVDQ